MGSITTSVQPSLEIIHSSQLKESKLPCPNPECGSSDAYHTYDDGHGYCFSCGQLFNSNIDAHTYTYEYLPHWNVSVDTFRKYGVKTKIDETGKPVSVGFIYPNKAVQVRKLEKKEFYTEGDIGNGGLFGKNTFEAGSNRTITVTEGAKDALSLYEVLRSPVVSVQSSSTAARDCTLDRTYLNAFDRIYFAFDADRPGRDALEECARLFDYNKVFVVKYNRKDANEYLVEGDADGLRTIWYSARKYVPENILSTFSEFDAILHRTPSKGIDYPFAKLTQMTYGIRKGESVLVTAQEGVGKTELMHAIEHKILKETKDAVGAIFLEETEQRHLQALAGIEIGRPVHLPGVDVSPSEQSSALHNLVAVDDRLHIYTHFGSDDPDHLLDQIRFLVSARGCVYILLDHISMVVSGLAGEDERQALDYFSTRLEMMVKELSFALIMVSHVNDNGQTRGSRMISKIADIRVDLARNVLAPTDEERRTVHLTLSKNRFSGQTGPAGSMLYVPEHCRYIEKALPWEGNNDNEFTSEIRNVA